jgi:S-adenosylmethionine:tRNA ribosyltransferase-isomerase
VTEATVAPLEAHEPPEVQGRNRADVAMLVATRRDGSLSHARFDDLPRYLASGDLLVVNTSATLPAAIPGRLGAREVELRLSTPTRDGNWIVELRSDGLAPLPAPPIGSRLDLPGGATAELLARHLGSARLSVARLSHAGPIDDYLHRHGRPIRYGYVGEEWPIDAYQTVFASEPGSAEMPSAGRPFTPELVTRLVVGGTLVAPVTLHTGVSSPERGEPPYPERYRVPVPTARLVNAVHAWGARVIAVGTTVVRALETVVAADGTVHPGEGTTDLVIAPERVLRAVDGVLTGWHDSASSHMDLLTAAAGHELLDHSYRTARARGYRFHEFGDVHLIIP